MSFFAFNDFFDILLPFVLAMAADCFCQRTIFIILYSTQELFELKLRLSCFVVQR